MSKKWYSYFVVTDDAKAESTDPAVAPEPAAPRRVDELVGSGASSPMPAPSQPAAVTDLTEVYDSARITAPQHGYTVLKVADMLQSAHIKELPADVRRKSVLVALDAAGVTIDDILADAVRRDQALDTYERVLQQHADDLAAKIAAENRQLEDEIGRRVAELRAQIDENVRRLATEQGEVQAWRERKRQEEALIADTVGHFVSENPITVAPRQERSRGDGNAG